MSTAPTTTLDAPTSDLMGTPDPTAPSSAFAERIMAATLGAMELMAVHLGDRLGWYRALAAEGPLTSAELAALTGSAERYAREWLEHQAASGYLVADDAEPAPTRSYHLATGAAEALTDPDSLDHVGPMGGFVTAAARVADQLVEAYRTGGGVPWSALGADARQAQAALNRPLLLHVLGAEVVPTLPELHRLLDAGARVADVGCGEGWSAIGLATAYPGARVDGFDVDEPSVAAAARHAATAGVGDRVAFAAVDAADLDDTHASRYDVVTAFECVHDLADPVGVLSAMRRVVTDDGYVLVMDERTQERFTAPAPPVERLFYGYSLICCLPDGLSRPGGVGTGTVMRPATLEAYAVEAGFSRVETLPVEHEVFRFYRLHV